MTNFNPKTIARRRQLPVWRGLTMVLLVALLGCGSGTQLTTPPPQSGTKQPRTLAELRAEGRRKLAQRRLAARPTREELWARRQAFARVIPPEVQLAFERAGLPAAQPVRNPAGKAASNVLPMFVEAQKQYTGPGDYGYIAASPDVTFTDFPDPPGAQLNPSGATLPDSFSYVVYRVDDITQQPTALSVTLNGGPFPPGLEMGIACYNWAYGSTGRWEPLFYGDATGGWISAPLDGVPGASWTNANNNLAFVLFALAPHVIDVQGIDISEKPANNPPDAWLEANPSSGPAPLSTVLDASASMDWDGTIEDFSFDPGDGTGYVSNGTDPEFDHTYINPGPYTATVQVTDDGGLTSEWQTTVIVSPSSYDEVETNEDTGTAQTLPTLPFENFSGAVGVGGNNDGLTNYDYFTFQSTPQAGDKISARLQYADNGGDNYIELTLLDAFGNWLGSNWGDPNSPLNYEFMPWDSGPFYLLAEAFSGASDYYLSVDDDFIVPVFYDEFEDNDIPDMFGGANQLYPLFTGTMTNWLGSVGSGPGYPGNDGDTEDWYFFLDEFTTVPADAMIQLDLTYDTANSTAMSLTLYDAEANELATQSDGDGQETVTYTVQATAVQPFYVRVKCGGGWGDYNLAGTIEVQNPGFDEDEHNDSPQQANDLGALPLADPFTGNVGLGGNYDSDPEDYYTFQTAPGLVQFIVTPDDPGALMNAYMFDGAGNTLGATQVDANGVVTLDALIFASTPTPYTLVVYNYDSYNDYEITSGTGSYSEVEDNDTDAQANPLPFGFIPYFSGSLGSGGSDYDGDQRDELTFTSQAGFMPYFDIYFEKDAALALIVMIRDAEGDVLGSAVNDGSGHITVTTDDPIDAADLSPYYLVLDCPPLPDNFTDYWLNGEGGP